jgi:hypothetical protein
VAGPASSPSSAPSVVDAASNTIVLAFDLAESQIVNMPDELAKALQQKDVQDAIRSVLANLALAKQKSGSTTMTEQEAMQVAQAVGKAAGDKITSSVLDQMKKTPEYKALDQSMKDLQQAMKSSPLGLWVDRNSGILYVIGAGLVLGGATALYVTKTGGPAVDFPISQLTGKSVQVFKVGQFSLKGSLLKFDPATQTAGAALMGTEKWDKLEVSVQFGVVATAGDVKQVSGQVVFKTPQVNLGLTGSAQPSDKTVNLGLSLRVSTTGQPGPLTIGLGAVIKDNKVDSAQLNAAMKTRVGDFGLTGSESKGEHKVMATWSVSF